MSGKFGETQNFDLRFAQPFDQSFGLIEKAAAKCGKIKLSDKSLGLVQFRARAGLSNWVHFSVNISPDGTEASIIHTAATCNDGTIGLNSIGRTYDKFIGCISRTQSDAH